MEYDIDRHLIDLGFQDVSTTRVREHARLFQIVTPETNLIINLFEIPYICDGRPTVDRRFYEGAITSRNHLERLLSKFQGNTTATAEKVIIYTLPVEFERKIIAPSRPVTVVTGGKLSTIKIGEAVRVEDAEAKIPESLNLLLTADDREFDRVTGTKEENPRGKLTMEDATVVKVWQRRI